LTSLFEINSLPPSTLIFTHPSSGFAHRACAWRIFAAAAAVLD